MKRNLTTTAAALMLLLMACQKDVKQQSAVNSTSQENASVAQTAEFKPGELLIKFKPNISQASRNSLLASVNGAIKKQVLSQAMRHYGDKEGFFVVNLKGDVMQAIQKLKGLPQLVYAEPNYVYHHDVISNDPYYTDGRLWGMYGDASTPANQYGSQAAEAWAKGHTGSKYVVVGVVDEGAMYSHEDLGANYPMNPFDKADGIDNDGNGYIDDIHGWDFFSDDNSTFDGAVDDHGTHVSGTIGAVGGNNRGVAGVNWKVAMVSGKFLGPNGGFTDDAVLAVDYMIDLKIRHKAKLVALNNSWGGGGYSQALKDAIDRADSANILFVVAAGNNFKSNNDVTPYYPAAYSSENIITVASITKTGALSYFSNIGPTTVDIGAPGSGVFSTVPGSDGITSSYASYDGTSMATPHVTGACALYASTHPNATAAQIKNAILSSAIPTPSLAGKCVTGGRLNLSGF